MILADSGFWVALFNPRDRFHAPAVVAAARHEREGFITTQAVVTEASYLLAARRHPGLAANFIAALFDASVELFEPGREALPRAARLMSQYLSLPMDYADASLLLLAEHLGHGRILTTDQRDFGSYRWKNHYPFDNLLEVV